MRRRLTTSARIATSRPRRRLSTCAASGLKTHRTGSKASSTGPLRCALSIRRSAWASRSARYKSRIHRSPSRRSVRTPVDRMQLELVAGPESRRLTSGPTFSGRRSRATWKAGALDVMRDYPGQPDSELSTRRCVERLVIAGTPQTVADRILALRNEVGAFGTLLYTGHDWIDPALARRSMELMANEVWPRIDRAVHGTTPKEQTGGKVYSD